MSRARVAGLALLGGLSVLFALRLAWIVSNLSSLRPVGGGDAAPPFALSLLRGGEFRLQPGDGKVTLIDFWATWCGPCREELPQVDAVWRRYRDRGDGAVRVVAVDVEPIEAREFADKLATELHLGLPIALAGDGVAEAYHVNNLPELAVIGRDGRIARVLLGVHDQSEIVAAVEQALK